MTTKTDFSNLRDWLTQKLDERGMVVEDLARAAGVSRALIYDWMSDRFRPTHNTMPKVVRALSEAPIYTSKNGKTVESFLPVSLEEAYAQFSERKLGRPAGGGNGSGVRALKVSKRKD